MSIFPLTRCSWIAWSKTRNFNDWTQKVFNGETGTLKLLCREGQEPLY